MSDHLKFSENEMVLSAPQVPDSTLRESVESHAATADGFLAEVAQKAKEVDADRGLNTEGKQDAKAALREAVKAKAAKLTTGTLEHHRQEIQETETKLLDPASRLAVKDPDSPQTIRAENRWRERFETLAAGDPVEREQLRSLLVRLAEQDNRVALRALELDPTASEFPIVSDEVLSEVRAAHVRARYPEAAQKLAARRSALRALETNADAIERRMTEMLGPPPREDSEPRILSRAG